MNHDEWAAGQETTTVTVDGHDLSMAYCDDGLGSHSGSGGLDRQGNESGDNATGTDEPPVVFLHGIPMWSFL